MKKALAVFTMSQFFVILTGCSHGTHPSASANEPQQSERVVEAPKPVAAKPLDSVAILPFTGQWAKPDSAGPDWPQKMQSLLETLIPDSLAKGLVEKAAPGSLRVIANEVVRGVHSPDKSAIAIGKALNVAAVLSGRVAADGQLSVQLVAVDSGSLLWGKTYQLNYTLNPQILQVTFRVSINPEDHDDIVKNVILRLTGKEPVAPLKDKK
jgi:TolB-like protein